MTRKNSSLNFRSWPLTFLAACVVLGSCSDSSDDGGGSSEAEESGTHPYLTDQPIASLQTASNGSQITVTVFATGPDAIVKIDASLANRESGVAVSFTVAEMEQEGDSDEWNGTMEVEVPDSDELGEAVVQIILQEADYYPDGDYTWYKDWDDSSATKYEFTRDTDKFWTSEFDLVLVEIE